MDQAPQGSTAKASRFVLDDRLDRVEEMLSAGVPSGTIEKRLAGEYQIGRRQVRRYIQQVYRRREQERAQDAPYRRENLLRKIEHFYARCLAKERWGPAAQILVLEARLSGAFDHAADREELIKRLGPPPEDAGEVLIYARRVLVAQLYEVMVSPHLDFEKRQRIVSDLVFKIGATQSRTEADAAVLRLEGLLTDHRMLSGGPKIVDARSLDRPPTARGQAGSRGPRPLQADPPAQGADDPPGGGEA